MVDQEECVARSRIDHQGVICVFAEVGKGICYNDRGGPAVFESDSKLYLFGVHSFFIDECASGSPDGYAMVVHYRDWIFEHMNND